MTISVFDHPVLSGLLGDEEMGALFSARAETAAMLRFEAALAEAEAAEGVIPKGAGPEIASHLNHLTPDFLALREGAARDGMAVPALVKQLREAVGEPYGSHVHFGATSQDVVDTALALRLAEASAIMDVRLSALTEALDGLDKRFGMVEVMAHTRMQAAIPVPAARKIRSWRDPLMRHRTRLQALKPQIAILHFGGAAGTLEKLGGKGPAVAARMAKALGLNTVGHARHSERDGIAEFASLLSLITGSLGKMGQDIALMAQSEMGEVELAAGGGSSAMAHKKNPVKAEALVTLARFNATLASGMHHALVHENERSGAAWTLEWMLLPQMTVAAGVALRLAGGLAGEIAFVERKER